MARTIAAMLAAQVFDAVYVSTDDLEIDEVARAAGASVPGLRPAELATDSAPTLPVVQEMIERVGLVNDLVCCVYPAAVMIDPLTYQGAMEVAASTPDGKFVTSVVPFPQAIERALRILPDGQLEPRFPDSIELRSQALPAAWHDAGQFYWASAATWRSGLPILQNSVAFPLDPFCAVDIDTEDDWRRAELQFAAIQQ